MVRRQAPSPSVGCLLRGRRGGSVLDALLADADKASVIMRVNWTLVVAVGADVDESPRFTDRSRIAVRPIQTSDGGRHLCRRRRWRRGAPGSPPADAVPSLKPFLKS